MLADKPEVTAPDLNHEKSPPHSQIEPRRDSVSRWWSRLLARLFPAREDLFLTEEEMERLAPWVNRINSRAAFVCFVSLFVILVGLTTLFMWAQYLFRPAPANPVWDMQVTRSGLIPAIILTIPMMWIPVRVYLSWHLGEDLVWHDRYEATRTRCDDQRLWRTSFGVFLVLSIVLGIGYWHEGELIDENGITFKPGYCSIVHVPYSDVVSIVRYNQVHAPTGPVSRRGLQVRFRTGELLQIERGTKQVGYEQLIDAVSYISERSGVSIQALEFRPSD